VVYEIIQEPKGHFPINYVSLSGMKTGFSVLEIAIFGNNISLYSDNKKVPSFDGTFFDTDVD